MLLAVIIFNFILLSLVPGDIADTLAGESGGASQEVMDDIRRTYGLDRPFHIQLATYVGKVLQGDLGTSYYFNLPVTELILGRVAPTLLLVVTALVLAILIGTLFGVIASRKPNKLFSHFVTVLALVGFSAPVFWTAFLLIVLFVAMLEIMPLSGLVDPTTPRGTLAWYLDVLHHLFLPVLSLSSIYLAAYSRLARASMMDVLGSDYIRTARAKGLGETTVTYKHALRNAVIRLSPSLGSSSHTFFRARSWWRQCSPGRGSVRLPSSRSCAATRRPSWASCFLGHDRHHRQSADRHRIPGRGPPHPFSAQRMTEYPTTKPDSAPGASEGSSEVVHIERPVVEFLRMYMRNWSAVVGLLVFTAIILAALFAPVILAVDPFEMVWMPFTPPGQDGYVLGTDNLGRDMLTAIVYGARATLVVGGSAAALTIFIGITIGSLAGYYRGWVDEVLMRITEFFQVLPPLLLAMVLVALFEPTLTTVAIAIGVVTWTGVARLARAEFMRIRELEFVKAARSIGSRDRRIIWRVILPNALPPLIVNAALTVGVAILFEAALSFLGLSDPNVMSWGKLIGDNRDYLLDAPWTVTVPGVAIFLTVLAVSLIGDGLNDAFNPRLRER